MPHDRRFEAKLADGTLIQVSCKLAPGFITMIRRGDQPEIEIETEALTTFY